MIFNADLTWKSHITKITNQFNQSKTILGLMYLKNNATHACFTMAYIRLSLLGKCMHNILATSKGRF